MPAHTDRIDAESPVAAVTAFDLETADPSDDIEALADQMARTSVGALVIIRPDGEPAIVTERDIVHAVAFDVDAWAVDVMTRDVIEVPSTLSIADAAETMRTANVRHLLVRRADDKVGVVSIRDLLGPLIDSLD